MGLLCCIQNLFVYVIYTYGYTDMHVCVRTVLHSCVGTQAVPYLYLFILALVHKTHLFALYNQVSCPPRGLFVPCYTGPRT